jgi:hypothetical protein
MVIMRLKQRSEIRPTDSTPMNRYGFYGTLTAQQGKGEHLGEILLQAAALMNDAPGCILYVVTRVVENPVLGGTGLD